MSGVGLECGLIRNRIPGSSGHEERTGVGAGVTWQMVGAVSSRLRGNDGMGAGTTWQVVRAVGSWEALGRGNDGEDAGVTKMGSCLQSLAGG